MPLGRRTNLSTTNTREHSEKINPLSQSTAETDNENFTLFQAEEPRYKFSDIILNDSVYDTIQDVLELYEKRELLFNQWGLGERYKNQNRSAINLYGMSGTGKSMAAHAIASQLERKILTLDYSQIESKYVGETSKNLAAMFEYAKKSKSIIFFDEADALLNRRVTNMSNSTDVSVNQTRSVLLILMQNFDDLILFASNFITNYDPAFIRRILAHIKFEAPDEENRFKLWKMYIPNLLPTNADIKELARKFDNISGSDILSAVFSASLKAARIGEGLVKHIYFEEAIERIIKSKTDNEEQ